MQKMTITIPTTDNHGREHPTHQWEGLEQELQTAYGGFTRVQVSGQWSDTDYKGHIRLYRDKSVRYEILTERSYAKLQTIAKYHGRRFGQLCVLTTCEKTHADFVRTGLPLSSKEL